MRIGILGGSFDPPHLGHLFIASQAKEFVGLDQVWLMPLFQSHAGPFQKELTPVQHRLAMSKLLENADIKVSSFEIEQNKSSYTIDTLNELAKLYPEHNFYWITGSDQLDTFQKYKNWQEIIANHNLIIFPREKILPEFVEKVRKDLQLQDIPKNVILLHNKDLMLTNISSTRIRDRITNKLSIDYYVPEEIKEYIAEHNLYE